MNTKSSSKKSLKKNKNIDINKDIDYLCLIKNLSINNEKKKTKLMIIHLKYQQVI